MKTVTRRQIVLFLAGGLGLMLVGAGLVAIFTSAFTSTQIRDTQQTNSPLIVNSNRTLQIIEDCTTPGLPCYERGQRQLRGAITDINKVSIIAASCASGPREVTVTEIQACVIRRLAAQSRQP